MTDVKRPHKVAVPVRPDMSFVTSWTAFFRNFATLEGRASRKEYWNVAVVAVLLIVGLVTAAVVLPAGEAWWNLLLVLMITVATVMMVPLATLTIRRLHDVNRSGWWATLLWLPVIGLIVVWVWCAQPSDLRGVRFDNVHGRQPAAA